MLLRKIFSITTPLSNYLQSKSVDFIEALRLINTSKEHLAEMRSDKKYEELVKEAKQFANLHNLIEVNYKETRKRAKKMLPGEKALDEVQNSSFNKYRCDTYFTVLDKVINSIKSRFNDSNNILKDFTPLSPERLKTLKVKTNAFPKLVLLT